MFKNLSMKCVTGRVHVVVMFLTIVGGISLKSEAQADYPTSFRLTILDQPTAIDSVALGINNNDLILGELKVNDSSEALLWREKKAVEGFRKPQTRIGGINDAGIAVGALIRETGSTLFLQDGDKKTVLENSAGMKFRMPLAINNASMVAGISYRDDSEVDSWTWKDGTTLRLPTLGGSTTYIRGINNSGNVVGYSTLSNQGLKRAFIHNAKLGIKELASHDECESEAFGINDLGQIVGYTVDEFGAKRGALWEVENLTRLAALPGDRVSSAMAINDDGWVVGSSVSKNGTQQAVLWIDEQVYDLNEIVSSIGTTELIVAKDINNKGCIVGTARANGKLSVFLLEPVFDNIDQRRDALNLLNAAKVKAKPSYDKMYSEAFALAQVRHTKLLNILNHYLSEANRPSRVSIMNPFGGIRESAAQSGALAAAQAVETDLVALEENIAVFLDERSNGLLQHAWRYLPESERDSVLKSGVLTSSSVKAIRETHKH